MDTDSQPINKGSLESSAWLVVFLPVWAFASVELGFHLNIAFHWPAMDWRDLDVLNNRPALAVMLLAGLAFCHLNTGNNPLTRAFFTVPTTGTLQLAAMPSQSMWRLAVEQGYPNRVEYASGQWLYTAAIFFVVSIAAMHISERNHVPA